MSNKKSVRAFSNDAEKLALKLFKVREEILSKLTEKIKRTISFYIAKQRGDMINPPEGFISLNNRIRIVHKVNDEDGNLNEIIVGIHTDFPRVQTEVQGEVSEILFGDLNEDNLLQIITELDIQLEDPENIKIVQEDDY